MELSLLKGKRGLIMGVANNRSIAWGIAEAAHNAGAELAFTYAGDALKKRVEPLAESVGSTMVLDCDVTDDAAIAKTFQTLKQHWGTLDFIVHAIAFADKDELQGRFSNTSRKGFALAMDISAYSLIGIAREALPLMTHGGSIITLSYYGAEKVLPNYNVMGVAKAALEANVRYLAADLGQDNIRVNAISAGPIKTLAASGVGGFRNILNHYEANSPLGRNVTQEEVGKTSLWLLSDLASGVTGEVVYVDAGYNIMGASKNLAG